MEDWFSSTQALDSIDVEIGFVLSKEYDGEPLPLPAIPRTVETLVRSSELVGHEALLADYYREIIQRANRDGKRYAEIAHLFWMRLYLWNTEASVSVSFPWYDTYGEMKPFLQRVVSGESGRVHWDADQSWEIEVYRHEEQFYVKEWDPDDGEIHTLASFAAAVVVEKIPALMERVEAAIAELTRMLGDDVWTQRMEEPHWAAQAPAKPWYRRLWKRG